MRFWFCLFFVSLLFSCKKPQGFDYRGLNNFKIDSLGFEHSTISMNLVYFNPNNFGVDLKHVDCDIFVNKSLLGKYLLDTSMHIARRSEFSLPSKVQVDMRNIYKNSLNALFNQEIQVDIKGVTRVGKAGIFVNVPFTYSGTQKISLF
ncbi:MAG: LEA type 2 family protein [Bacteroidota bacterium]|nr:LEA type 2 family protein [Bacteroidota bacterium]